MWFTSIYTSPSAPKNPHAPTISCQTTKPPPPLPPSLSSIIMAAPRISLGGSFRLGNAQIQGPKHMTTVNPFWQLESPPFTALSLPRKHKLMTICFAVEETETPVTAAAQVEEDIETHIIASFTDRMARKNTERFTYLVAAVMSSFGITSMAVFAVYSRFAWQMEGGETPLSEMFGTFSLAFGAAVGMEYWARWAHKALWHDSLWHMHQSHHKPREGAFELNDVFAIINAVPAIALLAYGFFHKGLFPGLCFGAGLGITVFGMAYMFVHDGLVHKRFPVGPVANVPYLTKVAAAHQLHHMDKFNGVPFGLFLGPQEVEQVGGIEELDKEINRRIKSSS
ncbi:beta-carotene hydroxylase 2, chloroplastic-like [Apium graveolens]|uniref:beta-carotene hydroxylase 2, chloroplastic-like n=1 Tax=Apium graveolens TaxID=4045 RepID=UPI003D79C5F1